MVNNPYVLPGHEKGEALVRLQTSWVRVRAAVPVVRHQLQLAGEHLGDAIFNAWISAGSPRTVMKPGK